MKGFFIPVASLRALLDIYALPQETWLSAEHGMATIKDLLSLGLLEYDERGAVRTTQRAWAYISMLCNTPLPIQEVAWKDPRVFDTGAAVPQE